MIAYKYDENTKEYIGKQDCQVDPLESKLSGHKIYLTPANCTLIEPKAKEGFVNVFNGRSWDLVEDHRGKEYWLDTDHYYDSPRIMKDLGKFPENAIFHRPEKTEIEKTMERVAELKAKLSETDYVVIKIAEGRASKEDYAKVLEDREQWREEIRALENN